LTLVFINVCKRVVNEDDNEKRITALNYVQECENDAQAQNICVFNIVLKTAKE